MENKKLLTLLVSSGLTITAPYSLQSYSSEEAIIKAVSMSSKEFSEDLEFNNLTNGCCGGGTTCNGSC